MPRGNKREQIMKAAEKLFTNRRFHEITLDEVAGAAGVGKGTIYRYFEDKDDLFFQVATSGFDELCRILQAPASGKAPFEDQLLGVCRRISDFFRKRRQLLRMMQTEEVRMYWRRGQAKERWLARRRELVDAVGKVLAVGVREGAVRPDLDCDVLAAFLLGMLRTRARGVETDEPPPHEFVVDLFLQGAAPRPPAPGSGSDASPETS